MAKKGSQSSAKTIKSKTGVRAIHKQMRTKYHGAPEIAFFAQDWDDGYNVGGLFRLADGINATQIILTGKSPLPEQNPMIAVTSMGQHRRIPWRHFERHEDACEALHSEGWTLIGVEIADGAIEVSEFKFPPKACLVLGNEGAGLYGNVLKHCESCIFLPMFGKGRSLNVISAASVVAYMSLFNPK